MNHPGMSTECAIGHRSETSKDDGRRLGPVTRPEGLMSKKSGTDTDMAAHDCELGEIQGDLVDVGDGPADIGARKRTGMSEGAPA
jgi:hypothetical protein